jgi:hypothetical protein
MPPSSQDGGRSILYLYNGIQSTALGENQPMASKTSEDGSRSLSPLFPLSALGFCENFFEFAGPGVWSHVQASKCD